MGKAKAQPVIDDSADEAAALEQERELFNKVAAGDAEADEAIRLAMGGDDPGSDDQGGDPAQPPKEPAQPTGDQPPVQPDGQGGEPAPEPTGLEWLEELSEESRAAAQGMLTRQAQSIARLDQRVRSHLGQLQPTQRAVEQLRIQLRERDTKLEELQKQLPNSVGVDVTAHLKALYDHIDKEYADYPDEAAKLKTLARESVDGLVRSIPAPAPEKRAGESQPVPGVDKQSEIHNLALVYSDWGERRYSPEFFEWISSQPPEVKQLLHSPYASDNIILLDNFTADNPDWVPPQRAQDFHSLAQARHSPLFRGWAEAEGINPNADFRRIPDHQRDFILSRFKADLAQVDSEDDAGEQAPEPQAPQAQRIVNRRSEHLRDRNPGPRRLAVRPGQPLDLNTRDGQIALYNQFIDEDPDARRQANR